VSRLREWWRKLERVSPVQGFPMRSPLASIGQHFSIDIQAHALYWARSRRARGGLELLEWGRVPLEYESQGESLVREIARVPWVRVTHLEVPMRSPDLRHRRIELPVLTPAQARLVGHRKVQDFLAEQDEACTGSFLRVRQTGSYPIWLVAAPESVPALFENRWLAFGFAVHRLSSESLALGNLTRILPPLAEGELVAVLELHQDGGDCVIADAQGWHFNRMIPMRHARVLGSTDALGESGGKQEGLSRVQLERVETELERTFVYVERELRIGRVVRLVLTGELPDLELLRDHLSERLESEVGCIGDFIEAGPAARLPAAAARAVGLVLAPDARGCSLLSPESKERRRRRRARFQLHVACTILGAVLTLVSGAMAVHGLSAESATARMAEEMGSNAERLEIIDETARTRERASRLDRALATIRRAEPPWFDVLEVISRKLPADVALRDMRLERRERSWVCELSIEARGATVSDAASHVAEFRERLATVPFLRVSEVGRDRSHQTVQDETRSRVFFSLRAELSALVPEPAGAGGRP